MSASDFVPASRVLFDSWQRNFVNVVNSNISAWGLSPAAIAEWALLTTTPGKKKMRWDAAWAIVKTNNSTTSQKVALKEALRAYKSGNRKMAGDTSIRMFINRYIRYNPLVTAPQKAEMGLTVPDDTRTFHSDAKLKSSGNELSGHVGSASHLVHHNVVITTGQKSKARGADVLSIQVFIFITADLSTNPPGIKQFAFDGTVRRGKYLRVFAPEQEGMRAWYYARRVIRGKVETYGPPSTLWSAVIM